MRSKRKQRQLEEWAIERAERRKAQQAGALGRAAETRSRVGSFSASQAEPSPAPKSVRWIDDGYRAWVRKKPCCIGGGCFGAMHAHHTKTKGSGGGDETCVPLCAEHHTQVHAMGFQSFDTYHGVKLSRVAAKLYEEYWT
jgi:hypothetical protein